ncbi:DUF3883 domain-containing protein [Microbacterium lacticum]|uniref:DUF3883 domain-containing protein n=1 Tax=Microbacterium lacticum TaxID=33885 RepID=UPI003A844A16
MSYEFPDAYLSRIVEGERFIYHQPRFYTGLGLVGRVAPSAVAGRSVCEILDWQPFDPPLPLKDEGGDYFEVDREAGQANVYWAQGVRTLTEAAFQRIVAATTVSGPVENAGESPSYADTATRKAVERYAVEAVLKLLHSEHPDVEVEELPPNNPGFDIRVGDAGAPLRFVEVKGTQAAEPVFWLTEGERQFSIANAESYELFVVAGIDLSGSKMHHLHRHAGAVVHEAVSLEPSQWRGRII